MSRVVSLFLPPWPRIASGGGTPARHRVIARWGRSCRRPPHCRKEEDRLCQGGKQPIWNAVCSRTFTSSCAMKPCARFLYLLLVKLNSSTGICISAERPWPVGAMFSFRRRSKLVLNVVAEAVMYPEAVTTNGDDGKSPLPGKKPGWAVDYGRLTPLIVKAVQELKADNDNLRHEVEEPPSCSCTLISGEALGRDRTKATDWLITDRRKLIRACPSMIFNQHQTNERDGYTPISSLPQ